MAAKELISTDKLGRVAVMTKENAIRLFNDHRIRVLWDYEHEKWFLSIVCVIEVLTGSDRPRKYWSDLKRKLKVEGSQLSEKIGQLKMLSADGKYYNGCC